MIGRFWVDTRGVLEERDEGGRSVRERTEADDLDCGLEEVSGASSKVSCFMGQHSVAVSQRHPLAPSRSEFSALSNFESIFAIVSISLSSQRSQPRGRPARFRSRENLE